MTVSLQREGAIGVLTLQRPEVFNCLNLETLVTLRDLIREISHDRDIRTVIVTGAGDKAFCSGADLRERRSMSPQQVDVYIQTIRDTFTELEKLPKPVIAAINGLALGGGTELALACDLRIMSEQAQMGLTETSLGIIPGAGGTQRLPRLVGKGVAKELIFTARRVFPEEALSIGLVNRIVPADQLMATAISLAEQISANAPLALAQAKFAIDCGVEVELASGLQIESNAYKLLVPTKDRLEGLAAFQEKRKPIYRGE
ncbi:enoyl-CoA hydratase-related protein [Brevibacillus formosus]|uniref:enoyl-CoA hydratase-related protein n=1 Tax=Brevibacillus TaxID=55080 RepID=UPI000D111FAE|nr:MULTISPECIES: enoyl-CoA hydratase-related protein [Brevibacillus]MBG9944847.1 enoyl-CoA hydratase [Brevibacillus formosus]MED1947355.1 enoyl-CoA hydratase-related protein [Brevibacillus formosus]MED1997378.1 enoyl-CoA hydratase-related protein [Brevibacillus formosus]MED2083235.1 enoyl-CoA hydratase-related protein [Brevibacillus formosus]PSK16943.1 enoyl-CoA hydratase [Brevibacillus sp. NRRL NRS-603]